MIDEILKFNREFVERGDYKQYVTDKYPEKKLAVLSCMDTRLTELLPAALGLKNGDAKSAKERLSEIIIRKASEALRCLNQAKAAEAQK